MSPKQDLPARPRLEHLKAQAEQLAGAFAARDPEAIRRALIIAPPHPPPSRPEPPFTHASALLVIAREYGFPSWPALKKHVESREFPGTKEPNMNMIKLNLSPAVPKPATESEDTALVGLDIGSYAIKAVKLVRTPKGGYAASGLAYREIDASSGLASVQAASAALRDLTAKCGFPIRRVAVALSGSSAVLRPFDLETKDDAELRKYMQTEIEQYLPIDPEENVQDSQILGAPMTGDTGRSVMVAAGRTEAVEVLKLITKAAHLECAIVDCDDLALANMYALNHALNPDPATVFLLNIGARMTSMQLHAGGTFRFSRPLVWGGAPLTGATQIELGLDTREIAEDLKRRWPEDRRIRLTETFAGSLNGLAAELKRCLDFYGTQPKTTYATRILLTGGGAQAQVIGEFIGKSLELPVELMNPFGAIELPAAIPGRKLADEHGPAFAVAVGLALRRFD